MPHIQRASDVKTNNLLQIVDFILEKGETNPTQIKEDMDLSWGSVSNGINELLERGILVDKKMDSSGKRGKKEPISASMKGKTILSASLCSVQDCLAL